MFRLRPFKTGDEQYLEKWLMDKTVYSWWGGNHIGEFPLTKEVIHEVYIDKNGMCKEKDNFYPWIMEDDDKAVGSFIMRYIGDKNTLRFGWVVVDSEIRGMGYGKKMLSIGLQYAFDIYHTNKVTIGVFDNNPRAYSCYTKLGFKEASEQPNHIEIVDGSPVKIIELEYVK